MSKILFLQNIGDQNGGIINVNKVLASGFKQNGHKCYLICLRNGGYNNKIDFSEFIYKKNINEIDEWGLIKGSDIKHQLYNFHLSKALLLMVKRVKYKAKLKKDFNKLKKQIKTLRPDMIINSHYEILNAIPKDYLKKTIMHYHTNFNTVIENKNCRKTLKKYKNKIAKYVWLTRETCNKAICFGLPNSIYIYNPVRISFKGASDVINNKKLIFLGRISKEKRLDLLVDIYSEVKKDIIFKDWTLDIYGIGTIPTNLKPKIELDTSITLKKPTDDIISAFLKASINLNTSEFEGFSMTILEGNELGVPTITFDFGETVKEQIINWKTGVIVEKDDKEAYIRKLKDMMLNTQKLYKMSKDCKEYSKNFQPEKIYTNWNKLYEEINKGVKK